MIVAVTTVRMMQVAGDAIIHMIAMRHRLMTTAGTMHMVRRMAAAAVIGGAAVRVLARYLDPVLVDMTLMRVMQMTVDQIIRVVAMRHGLMAASRSMRVASAAGLRSAD